MAYPLDKRKRVFLATRGIFVGRHALVRKYKKVRELICEHQDSKDELREVLKDMDMEIVVCVAKELLEMRVFDTPTEARSMFPDLFPSEKVDDGSSWSASGSPAATTGSGTTSSPTVFVFGEEIVPVEGNLYPTFMPYTERDNNIMNVFQSISAMFTYIKYSPEELRLAFYNSNKTSKVRSSGVPIKSEDGPSTLKGVVGGTSINGQSHNAPTGPLYPAYFPYSAQHTVLTSAQSLLEDTCFDFVSKHNPSLLTSGNHNYDCGAALELNKWTCMIIGHESKFPKNALKLAGGDLAKLLATADKLRDTAVYRKHVTAREVVDLVANAVKVCEALGNDQMTKKLGKLHSEVEKNVVKLERGKDTLEAWMRKKKEEFRMEREALDRSEKEFLEKVAKKDAENKMLLGDALAEKVRRMCLRETSIAAEGKGKQDWKSSGHVLDDEDSFSDDEPEPELKPEYML